MGGKLYTSIMNWLALIKQLLPLLGDKRDILGLVMIMSLGGQYVLAKHEEAVAKIQKQEERLRDIDKNQAVIAESLKAINNNLLDMKQSIEKTEKRVWRISQRGVRLNPRTTEN